jgi:hypothetical protein
MTITVDDDDSSAIQFRLYEAIGIWPRDERSWGTTLFGKGGMNGAVYLTIKAPFASSIVVTAQIPSELHPAGEMFNNQTAEMVWTCGRAVVGSTASVVHNGLQLPRRARLRLHRNHHVQLVPLQLLELLRSPVGTATMVIAYTMLIDADGLNSFEGCLRQHSELNATSERNLSTSPFSLIAGGLEDISSSSFYFQQVENERYTFAGVGVTHMEFNPHGRIAMYRIFDSDPMLLPASAGQSWTWRNGETVDMATGLKCVNMTGPQIGDSLHNATVTTHAWTYELKTDDTQAPVLDAVEPERIGLELGEPLALVGAFNVHTDSTKQLCRFTPVGGTAWNTDPYTGNGPTARLYANMTLLNATHAQCVSPGAANIPPPAPTPLCKGCDTFAVIEGPGTLAVSHDGDSWSNERAFQFIPLTNVAFGKFPFIGEEKGELLLKTDGKLSGQLLTVEATLPCILGKIWRWNAVIGGSSATLPLDFDGLPSWVHNDMQINVTLADGHTIVQWKRFLRVPSPALPTVEPVQLDRTRAGLLVAGQRECNNSSTDISFCI